MVTDKYCLGLEVEGAVVTGHDPHKYVCFVIPFSALKAVLRCFSGSKCLWVWKVTQESF